MSPESIQVDRPIGEVIAVATGSFVAHCVSLAGPPAFLDPPDFGAIVRIGAAPGRIDLAARAEEAGEPDPFEAPQPWSVSPRLGPNLVYAVVGHARMTALDSGRRPMALGKDAEALRRDHPQIFELVATEFSGLFVAHTEPDGLLARRIPPRPPHLHSRIFACSADETVAATSDLSFLQRILAGQAADAPADELCAATIRCAYAVRGRDTAYLASAGRQLGALLGGDYDRLQRILRAVL